MQNDASYTLTDLLMDDSFRVWVTSNGRKNHQRWATWMEKYPEKVYLVEEAKKTLLSFEIDPYLFPGDKKEYLRQKVAAIAQNKGSIQQDSIRPQIQTPVRRFVHWPRIAAAVLTFLTLSGLLYTWLQQRNDLLEYHTTYGEIKEFQLPDGSRVTLNANSTLTLPASWDAQDARRNVSRKVWLKGEAYFEVEKKYTLIDENNAVLHQKFMVYTDNLVVEVLGTKFNVNNRHENTEVVLNSGSVKLQMSEQEIMMEPGDYVTVSTQQKSVTKKVINPENYTAWRSGELYFEGASVDEIKQTLKDNYDIEVIFEDWEKTEGVALRGTFPTNDLQLLLQALANTTHTEMRKQGKQIFYK